MTTRGGVGNLPLATLMTSVLKFSHDFFRIIVSGVWGFLSFTRGDNDSDNTKIKKTVARFDSQTTIKFSFIAEDDSFSVETYIWYSGERQVFIPFSSLDNNTKINSNRKFVYSLF